VRTIRWLSIVELDNIERVFKNPATRVTRSGIVRLDDIERVFKNPAKRATRFTIARLDNERVFKRVTIPVLNRRHDVIP
jgi:hypothetical protein